jgi:hypothetical protein
MISPLSPKESKTKPLYKGMKRIGLDFLLYDFDEKNAMPLHSKSFFRPEKPVRFQLNETNIEIWYQGNLPVMVCDCADHAPGCACHHKTKLCEKFLVKLMDEIFDFYEGSSTLEFLRDEMAQKIRLIYPKIEKPVFSKKKAA